MVIIITVLVALYVLVGIGVAGFALLAISALGREPRLLTKDALAGFLFLFLIWPFLAGLVLYSRYGRKS